MTRPEVRSGLIWHAGRWRLGLSTIADVADRLLAAYQLAR